MGLIAVFLAMSGVIVAALAAVGWVVSVADSAPNLSELHANKAQPLSEIFASDGTRLGYIHTDTVYQYVPGWLVPATLKEATVAIEDRRFWHHGALDYQGILRAGIKDLFGHSGFRQGASTLTMQLVDNMYLVGTAYAHNHNIKYKIVQAKLAQQLEKQHNKTWILENYLNDVPYGTVGGQTAVGVGAAAQMFFDRPPWRLDLAQQALLAGLPQAPSEYNPFQAPNLALGRRNAVLQAMVASGYITQDQANAAEQEPLRIKHNTTYNARKEPYVFDYVHQQLIQKLGLATVNRGGLKVYTTINLNMQQVARQALDSHEGGAGNPAAAMATVDPSNGHILAMASTASYDQTKFDYPVQSERQTGSAFKVFALMTLIHDYDGDPSQTYYDSKPLPAGWLPGYPNYEVHTAERSYQGTINVTKATILSDNTVFAQMASDLGFDKLDQMAHTMGITSRLEAFPSEVIGGLAHCCTMLEMADAYATIANGGYHVPATIISKVVFPDGSTVNFGDPPKTKVFTDGETAAAIAVLKQVITGGTGTNAGYGCPAAGKTGTANNMDNAWFAGFTPKLSTAVWVGYPQGNIPMPNGFGNTLAAPIWHDFMQQASNGFCGDFPPPTTPWSGQPYFGPLATTGKPVVTPTTGTSKTPKKKNPFNNPTLYSHGPGTQSGGTGVTPPPPPGKGPPPHKKHK